MDYLVEAKKFIQRAHEAFNPEVISQNISMADWCLSRAIKERDGEGGDEPKDEPKTAKAS